MFGERLKALRKSQGIAQHKLAQDLGFSQTYISTLENSEDFPKQELLKQIADYFSVGMSYFMADDDVTQTASIRDYVEALRHYTPESQGRFSKGIVEQSIEDLDLMDSD